ncbi:unnamed protein product [Mytilus coruscus]|uniref:Uncharacterized protein n=1 Tax=Mytilus coruscus TaxID=42192 RepID=A0A6J8CFD7_MYTCO|nr:unnamed protein product [Mytilus coruscus]
MKASSQSMDNVDLWPFHLFKRSFLHKNKLNVSGPDEVELLGLLEEMEHISDKEKGEILQYMDTSMSKKRRVNMRVIDIKKYIPGEDVILDCYIITSNHKITWLFENKVIWSGDKLNTTNINPLRYEITEELNLRIKNTNKPIGEMKNSNSNHSLESDGKYTEDPDDASNCLERGQWTVYSLISVSVLSAILISLLCVLLHKYRKSHYKSSNTGIHNIASETVELNDNTHVYNIIDENQLNDLMHDQTDDVAIASEGTHSSDQSNEESEYLHPYHSLVPVIEAEKQDYEQINVQNKEDVYVYDDTSRGTEQIRTKVHLVSENRTLSNSDCTGDDLTCADVRLKVCNTHSENNASGSSYHTNQPDQNNQFELVRVNIANLSQNCNPISDNISLD